MALRSWLYAVVTVAALVAPTPDLARANVDVGQEVDAPPLPQLGDRAKQEVISRAARVNVIVFFRPGQEHSSSALRGLASCEKEFASRAVHWVGIVSGAAPPEEVRSFVAATGVRMPIFADDGDRLYGAIGVHLHPTVVITDAAGKILAYEPFRKINWCDVVRARIQLALGDITPEQMEQVVSPERAPMPSELKSAAANRHVKLGRKLAAAGSWEQAERQARDAIAKDESFAPAHLLLGDALAGKGDCTAAVAAYEEALRLAPGDGNALAAKDRCCSPPAKSQ